MLHHITKNPPTSAASESVPRSRPEQEPISRKWIDALFARFRRIWPQFSDLVDQVGADEMAQEWSEGLAGLSGERIKRGIELCRQRCKWPPSIAEFIEACKGDDDWRHRGPAYRIHDNSHLLKAEPSEELKRKAVVSFAEMKAKLR